MKKCHSLVSTRYRFFWPDAGGFSERPPYFVAGERVGGVCSWWKKRGSIKKVLRYQ